MTATMVTAAPAAKLCTKCREAKPLENFYQNPRMKDGYFSACKTCSKRDAMRRYWRRLQDPESAAAFRAQACLRSKLWRESNSHDPEKKRAWSLAYYYRNRHKIAAQRKLQRAVARGDVAKPSDCSWCSATPAPRDLHGHHASGYDKPLEVEWICCSCRDIAHRKEIDETAVLAVTQVSSTPLLGHNIGKSNNVTLPTGARQLQH